MLQKMNAVGTEWVTADVTEDGPAEVLYNHYMRVRLDSKMNHTIYFDQILHSNACQHCLITGMGTGPRSAVGNMSDYKCVSDCRSRGREFDPGPVLYFRGD